MEVHLLRYDYESLSQPTGRLAHYLHRNNCLWLAGCGYVLICLTNMAGCALISHCNFCPFDIDQ